MKKVPPSSDYLQKLMTTIGINNFRELSRVSGISQWQLWRLEAGLLPKIEVEILLKLSCIFQVPVNELLENLYPESSLKIESLRQDNARIELEQLKLKYQQLQDSSRQEKENLLQQFQQETITILESYFVQIPTVIATIEKNPNLSITKVVPFLKYFEKLLVKWQIDTLEQVDQEVSYDPQIHQLMEGNAEKGDKVKVRYVGYRQGEKLLYRAKVSPIK